jgi:hypothetical protein
MQDLIRAIIELGPNWSFGLAALAAIRLSVALGLAEHMGRWLHRLDVWQEKIEYHGDNLTAEDLPGAGPIFAGVGALLVLGIFNGWYFIEIWGVVAAEAPGILGARSAVLGALLAIAQCLPTAIRGRDADARAFWFVLTTYFVVLAALYICAPIGVLFYSAVVAVGHIPIAMYRDGVRQQLKS